MCGFEDLSFIGGDASAMASSLTETASTGTDWGKIASGGLSLIGMGAKYAGGFLGVKNQVTAYKNQANMLQAEATLMDYNADLARWEKISAKRETDIEIAQHRDATRKIMGKNATYFSWGNIDISDPSGTPMQLAISNLYTAEYDEKIIVERGLIKQAQGESKAKGYEYAAASTRAAAGMTEEAAKTVKKTGALSLTGEVLKDMGAF